MEAGRTLGIRAPLLIAFVIAISAGTVCAQQRPGIRPFVTPPEGCSYSGSPETENLYSFTMAQIQALSFARAGERASLSALAGGDVLTGQIAKTIADLRQAQIQDTCAGFILSPYSNSKNENVATAAKYLAYAYDQLGKMTNEMLGIAMQASMQSRSWAPTAQLSELKQKRQGIIQNMTDALNLSLSLLLDQNHTDPEGKPDLLILTRDQRTSLMDFLRLKFPTLSDEKGSGHSDDFIKQAAVIQSFLAGNYSSRTSTTPPK
ncbi:MAG TPA: hypothetical protein VE398_15605 [Acidobacteriota bacterium]|nr:hypothetical protein [Acidobacteriota bacterium]